VSDAQYQLLPPLSEREYLALKADIAERGMQVPVELDEHGRVLDGHHRLRAWHELRAEGVAVVDYPSLIRAGMSEDEKRAYVVALNLYRRHLAAEARADLIRELRADGMTLQAIAGVAGVDERTVRRDLASVAETANAESEPEAIVNSRGQRRPATYRPRSVIAKNRREASRALAAIAEGGVATLGDELADVRELAGRVKNAQRQRHAAEIAAEPPPLPSGPFRVIVADPPWMYGSRANDPTHRARNPYPDMSVEDICALPVADLAADDCVLWLWTTNAHMREAFEVLDAWGFEQKTILTWVKDRMGTGDWLRGQTEHCLLATRGRPAILLTNQTTVLHGPLREHSRKPDEFYALVEALCPGSKVELFSRQAREGWVAHGSEVAA